MKLFLEYVLPNIIWIGCTILIGRINWNRGWHRGFDEARGIADNTIRFLQRELHRHCAEHDPEVRIMPMHPDDAARAARLTAFMNTPEMKAALTEALTGKKREPDA